jgi:hypothetical protein
MVRTEGPSKRSPRDFRGRRPRTLTGLDAVIVLLSAGVAVIVTLVLFSPLRRSPPPSRAALSPTVQSPTVQSTRHTNGAAGYSFFRPAGWEVSERGTVSELTGPDRDVILSFGLGPEGELWGASDKLAASIEGAYDEVQLQGPRREAIAGRSAIVVGGSAVNQAGVPVRFLAITIRIGGENYAISVFVAETSDPVKVLPVVEDIIASFEAA